MNHGDTEEGTTNQANHTNEQRAGFRWMVLLVFAHPVVYVATIPVMGFFEIPMHVGIVGVVSLSFLGSTAAITALTCWLASHNHVHGAVTATFIVIQIAIGLALVQFEWWVISQI